MFWCGSLLWKFLQQIAEPLSSMDVAETPKGTGRATAGKLWGCLLRFNVFPDEFPKPGVNVGQQQCYPCALFCKAS